MQPRNPNKPFLIPGTYAVLWFNKELKHLSTVVQENDRVAIKKDCETQLLTRPEGDNYVIVMPVHSSLINPWTPKGQSHEHI